VYYCVRSEKSNLLVIDDKIFTDPVTFYGTHNLNLASKLSKATTTLLDYLGQKQCISPLRNQNFVLDYGVQR